MTERLDLAEGKRLRQQWRTTTADSLAGVVFDEWVLDNADSLIAAAEEAEKLRGLLRTTQLCVKRCIVTDKRHGVTPEHDKLLAKIDAALIQPASPSSAGNMQSA